jgi:glycosyltransferase involved in cell wall biosynthesis
VANLPGSLLLITDRYPPHPGGLARSSQRLARHAAAAGIRAAVLVLRAEGPPGGLASVDEERLAVHRLGVLEDPAAHGQAAAQVLDWLQAEERFDLLHGQYGSSGGFLAAYHARRFGIASYVSLRGNDVDRDVYDPARAGALASALRHAGAVGAVSRALVRDARAFSGREEVRYTPNSVDGAVFAPGDGAALRAELGLGAAPVVGFCGELRAKKGAAFLLDAFEALPEALGAHLLLVGTLRPDERRLVDSLRGVRPDLGERIHVRPYTQDPAALRDAYAAMDVVASPSLWEGMPNAVLEAMACGRPVLASDAGGLPDLVVPGETGWVVSRHQLHRLGEALAEVLAVPPGEREALGRRGRDHVLREFPPERESRELLAGYAAALGGGLGAG